MTDTPARPPKTTLSQPAPLWEASTWGPYFEALFPPQKVSPWIAWKIRSTGVGIARRLWDQREQLRGEYEACTAPTGRGGRSSIRESCLTRCPLLRTGRAWAASGSMCEVTGWATPTGSNEPLYGRTDTKSPMVYSSTVHVAGGEEGSIRHDDDGRPAPSGGSPASDGRWVWPMNRLPR